MSGSKARKENGLRGFLTWLLNFLRLVFIFYLVFITWLAWQDGRHVEAIVQAVLLLWAAGFLFGLIGRVLSGRDEVESSEKKRGPISGSRTVEAMLFEGDPVKTKAARKVRDRFF